MTHHPDSFKPQAPASYYCSECKYRHNKGSIRYHDHWRHRTETPQALKKHPWRRVANQPAVREAQAQAQAAQEGGK